MIYSYFVTVNGQNGFPLSAPATQSAFSPRGLEVNSAEWETQGAF